MLGMSRKAPDPTRIRRDAARSREALTDAVERLLHGARVDFSIPELAAEAGVGVATAYRHFPAPSDALHAYYARAVGELVASFSDIDHQLTSNTTAEQRFSAYCRTWVAQARRWGPAVRHIRSHEGFIERLNAGDPEIVELYSALDSVLEDLIAAGDMRGPDSVAAVLMWVTIFDERVIYDLDRHHGWSEDRIVEHLTAAVRGALRIRE